MTALDWIVLIIAYLVSAGMFFTATVLLVSAARSLARRARFRLAHPHRDGCPCWPCREYEERVRDACAVGAGLIPGLPGDGEELDRRDQREWEAIVDGLTGPGERRTR